MSRPPTPLVDRLLSKVVVNEDGCWIFTGRLNNMGYGCIWSGPGGSVIFAHRAAYVLFRGQIPTGFELDHLCRIRACCNPEHLEAVTRRTNTLRSAAPVATNAVKTACANGHPFDVVNTYVWPRNGRRRCRKCGADNARRYASKKRGANV